MTQHFAAVRPWAEVAADLRMWIEDDWDDPNAVSSEIALLREAVALLELLDHSPTCECCRDDDGRFIGHAS